MASAITEAQKLLPQFKTAVQSKDNNKANNLLIQLKVCIRFELCFNMDNKQPEIFFRTTI